MQKKLLEKEPKDIGAILCCLEDFLSFVVELSMWWNAFAFYHDEIPLEYRENTSTIDAAIKMMVSLFVKNIYHGDGTLDSNTTKMHCGMHCVIDYLEYGGFMNYNVGMNEGGLRTWAKSISRTAQKRGVNLFNHQTTKCLFDHSLLMKVIRSDKTFHPDDKLYGNDEPKFRQSILDANGGVTLKTTGAKFRTNLAMGARLSLTATERHMTLEVNAKIQSFYWLEVAWNPFVYSWRCT
jgi:hypothetical protein